MQDSFDVSQVRYLPKTFEQWQFYHAQQIAIMEAAFEEEMQGIKGISFYELSDDLEYSNQLPYPHQLKPLKQLPYTKQFAYPEKSKPLKRFKYPKQLSWAGHQWMLQHPVKLPKDFSLKNLGSSLQRINLSYTDLTGEDLSGANLSEANLTGADLTQVNLEGADCSHADLSFACLVKAKMSETTQIQGAFFTSAQGIEEIIGPENVIQEISQASKYTTLTISEEQSIPVPPSIHYHKKSAVEIVTTAHPPQSLSQPPQAVPPSNPATALTQPPGDSKITIAA